MSFQALRRDRRGIALPVAIFALVVIGALVAGVFFTARIEVRSGENVMAGARATEAAQAGLMMGVPNVLTLGAGLTDGQTAVGTKTQLGSTGGYYQDSVTRLNRYMYILRSVGTYEVGSTVVSQRVLAMLVKRYMPDLNINAGATVVGTPSVKGSAVIDGNDHTPPGWTNCDPPGAAQPGIRTNSSEADIQKASNIVTSNPTEVSTNDTSVSNMKNVLDTLFYQLAGQANVTINAANGATVSADPDPSGSGTCNTSNSYNWGDPTRNSPAHACETYFPIVYINVAKSGGSLGSIRLHVVGQGVLLIDGDMEINASSNFSGLMLVRGTFGKANGNATITGAVVSQNADLDATGSEVTGNLTVNYSRCSVKTALDNLAVTAPTQYRGFIQF
jgi:hypothetical protein